MKDAHNDKLWTDLGMLIYHDNIFGLSWTMLQLLSMKAIAASLVIIEDQVVFYFLSSNKMI